MRFLSFLIHKKAKGHYIADNVFAGPLTGARNADSPDITDIRAVIVGGVGHVVCHNLAFNWGDGIDTYGSDLTAAIDIYNNEIYNMQDDAIELDYSHRNVRAFCNRISNSYMGISTQPVLGGPAYIFRNAMYNIGHKTFKMHVNPSGVLVFHNTVVKQGCPAELASSKSEIRNSVFRNNLLIGGQADYALETGAYIMPNCDFDYDGFGGGPFNKFMKWEQQRVDTIEVAHQSGPQEKHGVLIAKEKCFAKKVVFPKDTGTQFAAEEFPVEANDLRLAEKSDAIDRGVKLPNINDRCAGAAPDLGAYEYGAELPPYGPRK